MVNGNLFAFLCENFAFLCVKAGGLLLYRKETQRSTKFLKD